MRPSHAKMPMPTRRAAILAGAALSFGAAGGLGAIGPAWASDALEVITSDIRPLSLPGEAGARGIVLDIVAEAIRAIGRAPRFAFTSFADSLARARSVPGTLVTPVGRTAEREAHYTWVGRVLDVPQALGTLAQDPTRDLEGARALTRIGVVRGGLQETFLRQQGFAALVVLETGRDLAMALAEGRIEAWYASAPEIVAQFAAIGRADAVRLGPALQTVPAWLAAGPDTRDLPLAPLQAALARLEADGTVARIYRRYVPG